MFKIRGGKERTVFAWERQGDDLARVGVEREKLDFEKDSILLEK